MNYVSTSEGCPDVAYDSPGISNGFRDLTEYFLCHVIVGTDVEHVDRAILMKEKIQPCRDQTAGEVADSGAGEPAPIFVLPADIFCGKPNPDQCEMPGVGVDGQRSAAVMHSAGIAEGEDSAQETKIHQERQESLIQPGGFDPGENKTDIHRRTA